MSAVVLAGLELSVGSEPTPIITEESDLPRSAICHITRATLVSTATTTATTANQPTFYLKASISESQDIVLAALNTTHNSTVALELTFHADSRPMFSVTTTPDLKPDNKAKYAVHLSGYVDVEIDDEDDEGSEGDSEGEEMTAEEMAAMREAIKRGDYDGMDDDNSDEDDDLEDEEDDEASPEGEEDDEEGEEEEEVPPPAPAAGKKGAAAAAAAAATAAANNKRKQAPSTKGESDTPTQPTKQQKPNTPTTPATSTTQSTSTKQAKPAKQPTTTTTTTTAASSPAATILPSGLTIQDEVVGSGAEATNGRKVSIRYRGQLVSNGREFDSNMPKGKPFQFTLGGGECIEGFDKGVKGMKVGGRRVIVVPSELGYGKRGAPPSIPPNAQLKFTIELIKA